MGLLTKHLSAWQIVVITALVLIFIVTPLSVFTAAKFMQLSRASQFAKRQNLQIERLNQVQLGLDIIDQAITGITYYEQNPSLYAFNTDTSDFDFPSISFVSRVPTDFPESEKFANQIMRRIRLAVEESEFGERELVMYQTPLLALPEITETSGRHVIVQNLDTLLIMFWDATHNDWVPEWDHANSIPGRIKIELAGKRFDGSHATVDDIRVLNIPLLSQSITQSIQNPPLPASRSSGRPRGSSRPSSSSSKPRYTPEQIAEWRRRMEERRSSRVSGRTNYTDAQRDAYRKSMAEINHNRSRSSPNEPIMPSLPPGMIAGELGMLLYDANSTGYTDVREENGKRMKEGVSGPSDGSLGAPLVSSLSRGMVAGELGMLLYDANSTRSNRAGRSNRPSSINDVSTDLISGELGLFLFKGP